LSSKNTNEIGQNLFFVCLIFRVINGMKRALPHSPNKRDYVSKKVKQILGSPATESCPVKLPDGVMECVNDFYCRDDISRQAPGIRHFVWNTDIEGIKQQTQKVF
jgi:hypothetical protein